MIGLPEIAIIAAVGAVIFFGKSQILDWVKTVAQVKKTYQKELKAK